MPRPLNTLRLALTCSTALVAVGLVGKPHSAQAQDLQINSVYSVANGESLTFGDILISNNGPGLLQQTGGSLTSGNLFVGDGLTGSPATYTMTGGSHVSGQIQVGSKGSGIVTQQAGSIRASDVLFVGTWNGAGTYTLLGGDLSSAETTVGYEGAGTFVQTGGTHTTDGLYLGYLPQSSGTYHLDGGTLLTNGIEAGDGSEKIFNFNGGTLAAGASKGDFITGLLRLNVRNGGAIIDTSGYGITIGQSLLHSDIGGDRVVDGGLTKKGAGTLTLTAANTYTGKTTVTGGTDSASSVLSLSGPVAALGTASSDLSIGGTSGDVAELHVTGGASLASRNAILGMDRNASGSVIVSGAGSTWTNAGLINVGMLGTGRIDVSAGGFVQTQDAILASHGTGRGTITVTGPGSAWQSSGIVIVGENGGGLSGSQFMIADGGQAVVNDLWIGGSDSGSGLGRTSVAGTASTLLVNGDLHVGHSGDGGLTISDSGTVTVGPLGTGVVSIATLAGSAGTLIIGAEQGEAATGAGTLNASGIAFGAGTGRLILNHTAADYRLDASITGNGSIDVHAGTTALGGTNSYSGGTFIHGGVLEIASSANLGTGPVQIGGGNSRSATLRFTADTDFDRAVSLVSNSAVLDVVGGRDVTASGVISGLPGVSLTKNGAGTLRLTGANTYLGNTWLNAGTLVGDAGSFGAGNGFIVTADGTVLTLDQAVDADFSNQVRGAGMLVKSGAGTLVLTGENGHSGGTLIAQGGLTTAISSGFGAGPLTIQAPGTATLTGSASLGAIPVTNSGTLAFAGSATASTATIVNTAGLIDLAGLSAGGTSIGSLSGGGAVTLGSKSLTLGGVGGNDTFFGSIAGSGSLVKTGAGTLTLSGANTYAGGTTLAGGGLAVASGSALGTGALAMAADTTLDYALPSGGILSNAIVLNGNATLAVAAGLSANQDGAITGSGGFTKAGAGELHLWSPFGAAASNTYQGPTQVTAGKLVLHGGDAISDVSAVSISAGAALELSRIGDPNGETLGSLAGAGSVELTGRELTVGTNGQSTAFAGAIGDSFGGGTLVKAGAGTLTLTGANTYTGSTFVTGGTLRVDGALASQSVNVSSLGTLSGTGTVGGNVTVDGGHLAGRSGQTLAMNDLTLMSGSSLDVTIGSPSTTGLFQVNGDLRINGGTVNITPAVSTVLEAGVYRLIDYAGALYNNQSLTVGTPPIGQAAADFSIQTAVAGQVNLVNAQGLTLNFWDGGAASHLNNGTVDGGAGTWSTTSETWTDANGLVTMSMRPQPGFAVFQGEAATVTVDGTVSASGMQFATDGYVLTGGTVDFGNAGTVRVGDGVNDATTTATIASNLTGAGILVKTGGGTLRLTGGNTMAGGTLIAAGTLVATTAGLGTGAITNAGSLVIDQATDGTLAQAISGTGTLTKTGTGRLTLSGANSYSGSTTVTGGLLTAAVTAALGSGGLTVTGGGASFVDAAAAGARAITVASGYLDFKDTASAGSATIANSGQTSFWNGAGAGSATITNQGGDTNFLDSSSAGTAQITNADASSDIWFFDTTSAGTARLTNNGGRIIFENASSAGQSVITNTAGSIIFAGAATADEASIAHAAGTVSIRNLTAAGTSIGSLSGAGDVSLGAKTLTLGGLNRNDTLSGVIADAGLGGSLVKAGTGTLTLSGANTYTGATTINGGTLAVNGSLASGATVNSGASLTGAGTIGGAVVIADGGHLVGTSGQTLTMGSLALGSGSIVDVTIGASAPQALFDVAGNVTLDGTLNVSDATGFGIGVTRLFDYGGALTNNGLAIGATPGGSTAFDFSVQTAAAGQVNLVNGTDVTLNFWDGGNPSHLNNGAVDGGDGTWSAASETWTDIDGRVTLSMRPQPGFAVFQGTAGTVTVDGSAGAVSVAGMQFAVDGYEVAGDAVELSQPQSIIRVGDGTATGAGYTATIGSALMGSGGLVKTDRGTLVLTGDNTYSGGTTVAGGTLQVASNNNLGAASGGLTFDGGRLLYGAGFDSARAITLAAGGGTFDTNGFDAALTGPVSGTGGLIKAGTGTLILTGANTSTGGTVIAAGTLVASTASLGSGAIVNDAALVLEQAADGAIAGSLSGTGTLTKTGAGTLTLSGDGSGFTGATRIQQGGLLLTGRLASAVDISTAGTLQVGDGVQAGDITGATANNGTLVFNQPGDYDYTGALSGSGSLIKRGTGLLTLSGDYTYTGSTVTEGGAVRLDATLNPETDLVITNGTFDLGARRQTIAGLSGTGGTLHFGGAALTVNQQGNTTFAGSLTGTGTLVKAGDGRLNLTGVSPFSGSTFVQGGTLAVNGSLAQSVVSVQGGILGGNGTIGGLIVRNSGIAAPGNSIGALTVAGNMRFESGSVYQVEVNAAGQNDRINAVGTATLSGGTVQVLAAPGAYAPLTRYTILTASGGVTGSFADVTSNLAFLDPRLTYTPNAVQLTMYSNGISFTDVARTANQLATAGSIESLALGNPVYDAVLQLEAADARTAFDALSGEVHASAAGALVETSRFVRDAVIDRLVQGTAPAAVPAAFAADLPAAAVPTPVPVPAVRAPQWGFWGQGFGAWGQSDGSHDAAKADRSTGGFLLGLDGGIGETGRLGFAAGYSSTSVDVDARRSSANIDSYHAAIYGGTHFGHLALRLGGAYTWHDLETTRMVAFPGFSDVLRADYRARTGQMFGELGYSLTVGGASFEPFAGLAYVNVDTGRIREQGGAAALNGPGGSQDVTYSTLGLRIATTVAVSEGAVLTARGTIGWRHAFDEVSPLARLTFSTGLPFAVSGTPIAQDALVLDAELGVEIDTDVSLGIAYGGQLARDVQDHSLKGNVTFRF